MVKTHTQRKAFIGTKQELCTHEFIEYQMLCVHLLILISSTDPMTIIG